MNQKPLTVPGAVDVNKLLKFWELRNEIITALCRLTMVEERTYYRKKYYDLVERLDAVVHSDTPTDKAEGE